MLFFLSFTDGGPASLCATWRPFLPNVYSSTTRDARRRRRPLARWAEYFRGKEWGEPGLYAVRQEGEVIKIRGWIEAGIREIPCSF